MNEWQSLCTANTVVESLVIPALYILGFSPVFTIQMPPVPVQAGLVELLIIIIP